MSSSDRNPFTGTVRSGRAHEAGRALDLRRAAALCWLLPLLCGSAVAAEGSAPRPSILFLFADQWRAQATGYAGDPNVKTPHLDRLAADGVNCPGAVSVCPVCSPYRATLLTGQRPLTHGVFLNDVQLPADRVTIAEVFAEAGYETAYIGKWHLDGRGRSSFIPRERRQGFRYWKVLECTHAYNRSDYFADENARLRWDGYDAIAQTKDAQAYLRERAKEDRPFILVVSWGPPHAPYLTAPETYRRMYDPESLVLRPNVPAEKEKAVRRDLAGYYAHCTALDDCVGELRKTLEETGLEKRTILVFTSDHGDLLGSQGYYKKQQPFDESIRVPLLFRHPPLLAGGRKLPAPVSSEDLMPTLLGLCGVQIPEGVEGLDYSSYLRGGSDPSDGAALIMCPHPFGQWPRRIGGREYRGLRTARYTYVRDLKGPWLLFDNQADPYQMRNLAGVAEYAELQARLDAFLARRLRAAEDEFFPGMEYVRKWGYPVDASETVPYRD
ncbi:MAG: sulfatase [Planctomycetes bacterium]|nr:sulfatase [Planctomycetota bacterium]